MFFYETVEMKQKTASGLFLWEQPGWSFLSRRWFYWKEAELKIHFSVKFKIFFFYKKWSERSERL